LSVLQGRWIDKSSGVRRGLWEGNKGWKLGDVENPTPPQIKFVGPSKSMYKMCAHENKVENKCLRPQRTSGGGLRLSRERRETWVREGTPGAKLNRDIGEAVNKKTGP